MSQCVECKTRMGFTESNVAREHKGLCVACHVKSLVKEKVAAANKPHLSLIHISEPTRPY